jgi:hypothetical protein
MVPSLLFKTPLFLLVLFCWLATAVLAVQIADAQRDILIQIRSELPSLETLPERPWTNELIDSACEGLNPYGVESCNATGWVTKLVFNSNSQGPELGTMPPSLGDMDALTEFWSYRTWSGSFPASLGNLSNLQKMEFYGNTLLGSAIPEEWKRLKSLETFVWTNSFNGQFELPDWVGEEWPNLTVFKWTNLGSSGPLPASFLSLPLVHLDLSYNQFSGAIPNEFANHSVLESLYLSSNLFTSVPLDWSNATNLAELGLEANQLTNLPTTLPPSIKKFLASNNPFNSSIPQSYFDIPTLTKLSLSQAGLTGELPWSSNSINSGLESLELRLNPDLRGSLPSGFFHLPHLKTVDIRNTGISGPLPDNITPACALEQLLADHSPLGGPLPSKIDFCAHLAVISLVDCGLSGTLPESFTNMSNLVFLRLSQNDLDGSLPPNWSQNTQLYHLYLDHNRLSGSVPTSLVKLIDHAQLDRLFIEANQFDLCENTAITPGTIPSGFECNVEAQTPQECGCTGIWTPCLPEEMPSDCNGIPGYEPHDLPVPTSAPSSGPPTGSATSIRGSTSAWLLQAHVLMAFILATIGCFLISLSGPF